LFTLNYDILRSWRSAGNGVSIVSTNGYAGHALEHQRLGNRNRRDLASARRDKRSCAPDERFSSVNENFSPDLHIESRYIACTMKAT